MLTGFHLLLKTVRVGQEEAGVWIGGVLAVEVAVHVTVAVKSTSPLACVLIRDPPDQLDKVLRSDADGERYAARAGGLVRARYAVLARFLLRAR